MLPLDSPYLTVLDNFSSPRKIAIVVAQSSIVASAPPCTEPFMLRISSSTLYLKIRWLEFFSN